MCSLNIVPVSTFYFNLLLLNYFGSRALLNFIIGSSNQNNLFNEVVGQVYTLALSQEADVTFYSSHPTLVKELEQLITFLF